MNNKVIAIGLVVGVALLVGIYAISAGFNLNAGAKYYDSPEDIQKLADSGKSVKCDIENEQLQGIAYMDIQGNRVRFDVISHKVTPPPSNPNTPEDLKGLEQPDHMIASRVEGYIWDEENEKGIVIDAASATPDFSSSVFLSQVMKEATPTTDNDGKAGKMEGVKCSEWDVDETFFNKPEGVEFVDPLKQVTDQSPQDKTDVSQDGSGDTVNP